VSAHAVFYVRGDRVGRDVREFQSWVRAPWLALKELPIPERFSNIGLIKEGNTRRRFSIMGAYPLARSRANSRTVMIPQQWFNKIKKHTHLPRKKVGEGHMNVVLGLVRTNVYI